MPAVDQDCRGACRRAKVSTAQPLARKPPGNNGRSRGSEPPFAIRYRTRRAGYKQHPWKRKFVARDFRPLEGIVTLTIVTCQRGDPLIGRRQSPRRPQRPKNPPRRASRLSSSRSPISAANRSRSISSMKSRRASLPIFRAFEVRSSSRATPPSRTRARRSTRKKSDASSACATFSDWRPRSPGRSTGRGGPTDFR